MDLLRFVFWVVVRILMIPFVVIMCVFMWLLATYREKELEINISERDFPGPRGSNDSPGSAGVDDTFAALRAKAGASGKA